MRTIASRKPLHELPLQGKISPEFSARLGRLKPQTKLHAIVLIRGREDSRRASRTRSTPEQRRFKVEQIRGASMEALKEIDEILRPFGGRRLSDKPATALGTVSVESNPAGITALANSNYVEAILEDQAISSVR